jgi:hypothetical protein
MWRMYRRQLAANKRNHYGHVSTGGDIDGGTDGPRRIRHSRKRSNGLPKVAYTGNTIRSFIALAHEDEATEGKLYMRVCVCLCVCVRNYETISYSY